MGNKNTKKYITYNTDNFIQYSFHESIFSREYKPYIFSFDNLKFINNKYKIKYKKYFLKFIKNLKLDDGIYFLAVDLLDISIKNIDDDFTNIDIYLVLLVSLSCKYIDDNINLKISYIIDCVNKKYNRDEVLFFEIKLLSFLNYKLSHPRLDTFIYYFLNQLNYTDIDLNILKTKSKIVILDVKRYSFNNSLIAISIIILSSKNKNIDYFYNNTDIRLVFPKKHIFIKKFKFCSDFIIYSCNKFKKFNKLL